jgi:flagellar hook-basal body complex protein FliE
MTSPISALGFAPGLSAIGGGVTAAGLGGVGAPGATPAATGDGGFADILTGQIDQLNGMQGTADGLAQAAATGDLQDAHDYMIASTEAKLATDTVVTLKNQAVAAFTEIMRMNV